ncbi:MAG: hypothetical protein ACREMP_05635 [Candidatus Tyrphobacter sp.]
MLVVAAIALIVAGVSIPAGRFVMGGDSPWPALNPHVALAQHASGWSDYAGFGEDDAFNRPVLPLAAADLVLEGIGLSPLAVNHLWMVLLILIQATATVRLFIELFPNVRGSAAIVFAGSAAILNPLLLLIFHTPYPALDLGIAAAPGLLAATIGFVRTGATRTLVEFAVWTALGVASNMNPAYVMEYVALMLCAAALVLFEVRGGRATRWRRLPAIALLYGGLNAPFWLPILHYAGSAFGSLSSSGQAYTSGTLASTSAFSRIENVVRLVGGYLFFNPVGANLYVPQGPSYVRDPLAIIATLGLPALAWSCAWFYRNARERALVWGVSGVAFAALFLAKGLSPPLGGIFAWLFAHLALFSAFRDSFGKFGWVLLLCYALLGGASLGALQHRMQPRHAAAVVAAAFVLLAGAAYPILSGHLFWAQAAVAPPRRYAALAAWERHLPSDARVAELPVASVLFDAYDWGYVGAGFNTNLTERSIVSRKYDFAQPGTAGLETLLQHYRTQVGIGNLASLLRFYGVTSVVSDSSMNPNYYAPSSDPGPAVIPGAKQVARFGTILAFAIDRGAGEGRVYAPSRIVVGASTPQQAAAFCSVVACNGVAFAGAWASAEFRTERVGFSGSAPNAALGRRVFSRAMGALAPAVQTLRGELRPLFERTGAIANFCAPADGVASRALSTPALRAGTLALRVGYRSAGDAWISVSSGSHSFSAELPPSQKGTLLRLIHTSAPAPLRIVAIAVGDGHPSCATIDLASVAAVGDALVLAGSSADLFETTPAGAQSEALAPVFDAYRAAQPGEAARAGNATAAAFWSPVTVLLGPSQNVRSTDDPDRLTISMRNGEADAYAFADRVLPGDAYVVHVPLSGWSGIAQVSVLGQSGEVLAQHAVTAADVRAGGVTMEVRNPLHSGRLQIYVYAGSQAPGLSSVTVGEPFVSASRQDDFMAVGPAAPLATPKSIRVREIDGATYVVHVAGAPPRYLLVLTESYASGWSAFVPRGVSATHVVANLFMNSWVVRGGGTYDIVLRYDGKKYAWLGLLACVLALAAAAGLQIAGVTR